MLKKSASRLHWVTLLAIAPLAVAAAEEAALEELELAEITGTRIPRAAIDSANPIASIDAEAIAFSGRTNLTDLLTQTPALVASTTSYDTAGSQNYGLGEAGLNLLDLRNLGTSRTLVLVNGRRHIAGAPGTAAVDINTMPLELIDRIDVLTGGVSAIYGADGVSGVVNFVTKRDFEGLVIHTQSGTSGHDDATNSFISVTGGKNLFGDRGNVALSWEYSADARVNTFDRARTGDPLRTWYLDSNPDDGADDPDVYDNVLLNDLRYADSSRDGAFYTDWIIDENGLNSGIPQFTGHGTAYDRGSALPNSGLVQGGSGTPLAGYQGDMQPRSRRHNVSLLTSFDLSDQLRLFGEAKYVQTKNYTLAQPSFDYFTYLSTENPFMPDVIRSAITPDSGVTGFGLPDGVLMSRDNFDIGTRGESATRETLRSVLGLEGKLGGSTRYELSWTYGETKARSIESDYRITDRYYAALDAVDEGLYLNGVANGNIRCRIDLDPTGSVIDPVNYGSEPLTFTPGADSGCAPLNLFGEYESSSAAQQFATTDLRNRSKVSHNVLSGSLTGDFGDGIAFSGGPVGYAVGAEYRKEKSSSVPDELIQQGYAQDLATILPEAGSFNVKELFAEINVPVLKDAPYAQTLSFGAAARWSDYSTVGNTLTWKVDARYAPVRDIMFRGTYSQAVRAPNITELYAPTGSGFFFVDDPCDPSLQGDGSQFRAANCQQLLTALGIDPDDFNPESDPSTVGGIEGTASGNPQLLEEKAHTWTLGLLLRPQSMPGLSISFDWYDIKLKNAINSATAQEFAELCVDQPTLDNVYCDAIDRDEDTGYINGWTVRPENVAGFSTAGADFSVDYRFAPSDAGEFHLSLAGGYLDKLTFIPTPGADPDSDRGEQYAPKWLATADLSWKHDRWSANYGINYFSKTRRFTTQEITANPDIADPKYFFYKAKWEHDAQVGFTPGNPDFRLYAGVNNLFDAKPSPGTRNYPVSFIGRFFYVGVRAKVDSNP